MLSKNTQIKIEYGLSDFAEKHITMLIPCLILFGGVRLFCAARDIHKLSPKRAIAGVVAVAMIITVISILPASVAGDDIESDIPSLCEDCGILADECECNFVALPALCEDCGMLIDECECNSVASPESCEDCGMHIDGCICVTPPPRCEDCGRFVDECICVDLPIITTTTSLETTTVNTEIVTTAFVATTTLPATTLPATPPTTTTAAYTTVEKSPPATLPTTAATVSEPVSESDIVTTNVKPPKHAEKPPTITPFEKMPKASEKPPVIIPAEKTPKASEKPPINSGGTTIINDSVFEEALKNANPRVKLNANTGSFISVEALKMIRESGKSIAIELINGLVVTIDSSEITNAARSINLNIDIYATKNGIEDYNIPAKSIVIFPSTHGEFGFKISFVVSAVQIAESGLVPSKARLYHIDGYNRVTNKGNFTINSDISVTVTINSASHYVLSEEIPGKKPTVSDNQSRGAVTPITPVIPTTSKTPLNRSLDLNPKTGVTLGFTSLVVTGGILLASRKRRKK